MCTNKRLKLSDLIEGVDFNWEIIRDEKIRVFTKEWLLMVRPKCCESGCKNCPWDFKFSSQHK